MKIKLMCPVSEPTVAKYVNEDGSEHFESVAFWFVAEEDELHSEGHSYGMVLGDGCGMDNAEKFDTFSGYILASEIPAEKAFTLAMTQFKAQQKPLPDSQPCVSSSQ